MQLVFGQNVDDPVVRVVANQEGPLVSNKWLMTIKNIKTYLKCRHFYWSTIQFPARPALLSVT